MCRRPRGYLGSAAGRCVIVWRTNRREREPRHANDYLNPNQPFANNELAQKAAPFLELCPDAGRINGQGYPLVVTDFYTFLDIRSYVVQAEEISASLAMGPNVRLLGSSEGCSAASPHTAFDGIPSSWFKCPDDVYKTTVVSNKSSQCYSRLVDGLFVPILIRHDQLEVVFGWIRFHSQTCIVIGWWI